MTNASADHKRSLRAWLGRREVQVGFVLVVAALGSLPWLVHGFTDPVLRVGDGAIYQLTAYSLLAGEGYTYLGEPFVLRPPGFPVLLMPILGLFGSDPLAVNTYVSLWGVAGVALLFAFYRHPLGIGPAAALAVVAWCHPLFRELSNQAMSDVPGLAVLFACLLCERWAAARPGLRRDWVLGVAIGMAAYVRISLVLLAPAILASRLFERALGGSAQPREPGLRGWTRFASLRLLPVLALALLVQAPWTIRSDQVVQTDPLEHTLFHSYSVAMWHVDKADPGSPRLGAGALARRVEKRWKQLTRALNHRLQGQGDAAAFPWLAGLGLVCWALVLVRRRAPVDFLVGGLLLLHSIYFGFTARLILPLYLMLLACVAQVAIWGLTPALGRKRARIALAAALVLLAWIDFQPRAGWAAVEERHAASERVVAYLRENFASDEPLASEFGAHTSLALGRPVYSLRWVARRQGEEGVLAFIEKYEIVGLVLDRRTSSGRQLLTVLEPRFGCEATVADRCILRISR